MVPRWDLGRWRARNVSVRRAVPLVLALAALGGCGSGAAHPPRPRSARTAPRPAPVVTRRATERPARRPDPVALVTAETVNRLVVVNLRTGVVERRLAMPPGPQYVAADSGAAVVTSPAAGTVTLLRGPAWRVGRVLGGLGAPRVDELSADGRFAFVSDDGRGTVTVIDLASARVVASLHVGAGAHHMAVSPDGRRLWVALGEQATTVVILDTSDPEHPRVVGRVRPGFSAHDLAFSPDGRTVWIASSSGADAAAFGSDDGRLLFHVPVGAPPQHVAFAGAYTYLTSGYGSTIERVVTRSGRVVAHARVPYGSFELDAAAGVVATASLLDGRLAILTPELRVRRVVQVAPVTRDVAIP